MRHEDDWDGTPIIVFDEEDRKAAVSLLVALSDGIVQQQYANYARCWAEAMSGRRPQSLKTVGWIQDLW